MKIRLLINGKTADLNEDGLVLLTYQASDATDPAAVKNSYSQNITLPGTPTNNAIFSHILRPDFKTASGFDVLARTPFEIRNDMNEILVSGYLKLNGGSEDGYDVTLFGGLGSFFYALMYNEDGTKRTLADLKWPYYNGAVWQWIDANSEWWEDMLGVTASAFASRYDTDNALNPDILPVTFAPFNEGTPKEFDAGKAYYKATGSDEVFDEVFTERGKTESGQVVWYYPKSGQGGGVLLDFGTEHDQWEMQEFRNTHQRPLWSVKSFLKAITYALNNGGYEVTIDNAFLSSPFVLNGWVTLQRDWADSIVGGCVNMATLLGGTDSPADYLLSIAKVCGLMFVCEANAKKVSIVTRNAFYSAHTAAKLTLDGILAEDKGKTITPLLMTDKWQVLSAECYGGRAEDFAERKGRQYGSLWVNTNYEFGGNEKDILASSVFKGAADILGSKIGYRTMPRHADSSTHQYTTYWLKFSATDTIKYKLYSLPDASGSQAELDCSPDYSTSGEMAFRPAYIKYYNTEAYGNVTELPQLCDKDGEAEDGSNVLVFYAGRLTLPTGTEGGNAWAAKFYATEDNAEMLSLNGDKPCWNLAHLAANRVTKIPVFRRQLVGASDWSMLYGKPGEFFTPSAAYVTGVADNDYLGARCWKGWLTERCDADIRRMKCWVNLRTAATPNVDGELLRYFWYYQGAWWVLDKINAHSLTTDDLTECEFIKVKDMSKYTNGQNWQ